MDGQRVGIDAPGQGGALGGVYGRRVAQGNVEVGIHEPGAVHLGRTQSQVYAVGAQPQFAHAPLDAYVADKSVGIESGTLQRQFVDHHATVKQRAQLHVGGQLLHVGQGVALVDGPEAVEPQVQRPLQAHGAYADVHTRLLRHYRRHTVYRPVLYRRHIEQCGEEDKQQDGRQGRDGRPFYSFLHA